MSGHGFGGKPYLTAIFFMTIGLCVVGAWAVCEPLTEGPADYCMIVCD